MLNLKQIKAAINAFSVKNTKTKQKTKQKTVGRVEEHSDTPLLTNFHVMPFSEAVAQVQHETRQKQRKARIIGYC